MNQIKKQRGLLTRTSRCIPSDGKVWQATQLTGTCCRVKGACFWKPRHVGLSVHERVLRYDTKGKLELATFTLVVRCVWNTYLLHFAKLTRLKSISGLSASCKHPEQVVAVSSFCPLVAGMWTIFSMKTLLNKLEDVFKMSSIYRIICALCCSSASH